MSAGQTDLEAMLRTMEPLVRDGEFVFVSVPAARAADLPAHATVAEAEGMTVVLRRAEADDAGLDYDFVAAWISLTVHSALDAVGLTAAFSAALARAGISCNVLAGLHHDHLLVPADRLADALEALGALSRSAGGPTG